MTTYRNLPPGVVVNEDDTPPKPPPLMTTGWLAWLRENLFRSAFDTALTFIGGAIALSTLIGLISWSINAANWFVITQNLEQIMTGVFPRDSLWRVNLAALVAAFLAGMSIYAYVHLSRSAALLLVGMMALLLALPPLINSATSPAPALLAAGNMPIASGSQTETPQQALAFVGRAGERITVTTAPIHDDTALLELAGFTDRAASALLNLALARQAAAARTVELDRLLAGDLLTPRQRAELEEERADLSVPPPITDAFALNSGAVTVAVRDGASGDLLAEMTLSAPDESLWLDLPADGWYVLEKHLAGAGTAVLRAYGMAPLLERSLTRDDGENGAVRVTEYVRISDRFETQAARPTADGAPLPIAVITDTQYRGARPFNDYLRLFAAPFLAQLSAFFIPALLVGAVGWGAGVGGGRIASIASARSIERRRPVRTLVGWLWIAYAFVVVLLIYGADGLDAVGLALILARFVWVGWAYYAGMSIDQPFGRGVLGAVMVIGLVQSVIIEGITLASFSQAPDNWLPQVLSAGVWLLIGYFAARRGAAARRLVRPQAARRGLIGGGVLWVAVIVGVVLALNMAGTTSELLPLIETQRWGGFLLTLMLTAVAIIGSFPLGVLLALGRRSGLPAIKLTCIVFIEVVRGVPLITVLFMAQLLVPLVNPALAEVDNVIRAMVGLTLFSAAYLAENVRGGLQSVSGGQEEAARALGLASWQITLYITLPQALRAVIPALVGQCIALFKDTSLVALVGLLDLTGTSRSVIAQPEFVGLQNEIFLFTSILYFIVSYIMAAISRRVEASGSGATRREL